ncbi:MAG: DUF853 domain-containing protein [Lachnospiraceae bacterium]|nr:DUF853 domain-containing protein [Lachnospiraceae bacterium]
MYYDGKILIGRTQEGKELFVYPKMANRHGLIAGATGTGKTVTLKVMAESFSDMGVPVFLADAKGDLAGMCVKPGETSEDMAKRIEYFKLAEKDFDFKKYPVNFWDVYAERGIQLRTTISEMGPILLSRILGLNDTQADILNIIFKIADDQNLLLIDTKDLKSMINYVGENAKEFSAEYGNISSASLNVITRSIVACESEGAEQFFAEPALNIKDWIRTSEEDGRGYIQILECQKLMLNPRMYSMFLLWMISELYETLPEAGDLDKPKMVFFFDEAHMLFDSAPKALLDKIEQVVKLIRSKGVGIYFITQNPKDIPGGVLSQLGNKIQHGLRAYTPSEQKGVKAAAEGLRENPAFDTFTALGELGTGEALVSVLGEDGVPTIVERAKILPPQSKIGTIDDGTLNEKINNSSLYDKYSNYVDNDSAYERLTKLGEEKAAEEARLEEEKLAAKEEAAAAKLAEKEAEKAKKEEEKAAAAKQRKVKNAAKSVASSTAGTIGREVGKTVGSTVGGKFGKTLGGNVGASLMRGIIGTFFK